MLAPCIPQARAPPSGHANPRRAAFHVGVLHPASPCSFVGHANPGAVSPARGLPCWRIAPRKPLFLRRTAPTPVPRSDSVRARLPAKPMNSVYEREPWNGKRRKSSSRSGLVRARLPAKSMNSVYEREPWNGKRRKSSSRSDSVRARLSAKPMNSVYEREPWNGKRRKSSPRSGSVRARLPAKPIKFGFRARTTGHVGVAFPSTPYSAVGLRQPRRLSRTCSRIV